jgi:hypothetical protein
MVTWRAAATDYGGTSPAARQLCRALIPTLNFADSQFNFADFHADATCRLVACAAREVFISADSCALSLHTLADTSLSLSLTLPSFSRLCYSAIHPEHRGRTSRYEQHNAWICSFWRAWCKLVGFFSS